MFLRACEIIGIVITVKGFENTIIVHDNNTHCNNLWS